MIMKKPAIEAGSVCQRTPVFVKRKLGFWYAGGQRSGHIIEKKELFQLQFANFFRFMAAYLSLTHLVTAAKPLWCV